VGGYSRKGGGIRLRITRRLANQSQIEERGYELNLGSGKQGVYKTLPRPTQRETIFPVHNKKLFIFRC
jgi:hypothetical protein